MSYIKVEARTLGAEYWLRLSPAAFTVHVWALSYCNEQATDGRIGSTAAERLNCPVRPAEIPGAWCELVDAGLWVETDDGYVCPDFLAYGLPADEQSETRDRWAFDKRRQRLHNIGNHSLCTRCRAMSDSDNSDINRNIVRPKSDDPTRPDPTRPLRGSGSGSGSAADSAKAASALPIELHPYTGECCTLPETNRHHIKAGA